VVQSKKKKKERKRKLEFCSSNDEKEGH